MAEIFQRPLHSAETRRLERKLIKVDRRCRRILLFQTVGMAIFPGACAGLRTSPEGSVVFHWIPGLTGAVALAAVGCLWGWWDWRRSRKDLSDAIHCGHAREVAIAPVRTCRLPDWEDLGDGFAFEIAGPQVVIYFGQDTRSPGKTFPRELITIALIENSRGDLVDEVISVEGKVLPIDRTIPETTMRALRTPVRLEIHPGTLEDVETLLRNTQS